MQCCALTSSKGTAKGVNIAWAALQVDAIGITSRSRLLQKHTLQVVALLSNKLWGLTRAVHALQVVALLSNKLWGLTHAKI